MDKQNGITNLPCCWHSKDSMEENLVEDTPKLDPCGDVEATKLLSQISQGRFGLTYSQHAAR